MRLQSRQTVLKLQVMPTLRRFFCPFCRIYCNPNERESHRQLHEREFRDCYARCGQECGHPISFGESRHSLCCSYHTVHLVHSNRDLLDVRRYVLDLLPSIRHMLNLPFLRCVRLRAQFMMYATFHRRTISEDEEEEEEEEFQQQAVFRGRMSSLTSHNVDAVGEDFLNHILPLIEEFCSQHSGWVLNSIDCLAIAFTCGRNDSGAGNKTFTTPPSLRRVRWCTNLRGIDGHCFPDSIRYCLAHADNLTGNQELRYINKIRALLSERYPLNMDDMPLPFEIKYFSAFQKKNPHLSLRVYHHDGEHMTGPLYVNTNDAAQAVHILFIHNPEKSTEPGHFLPITNIRAMINYVNTKRQYCPHNSPYYCEYCLQVFHTQATSTLHHAWCKDRHKKQAVEVGKETQHRFMDHRKTTRLLNIVYADMESIIDSETKQHKPAFVGAQQIWHPHYGQEHDKNCVEIFKGEDCVMQFMLYLRQKVAENVALLDTYTCTPMDMTPEEEERHRSLTHCEFCEKRFNNECLRVADHDHISGRYLHTLCNDCNLKRVQYRRRMTVVFHNLKGYDGHHLMRHGLSNMFDWELSPIYQSGDKLLGMIVHIPLDTCSSNDDEEEDDVDPEVEELRQRHRRRRRRRNVYTITFIDSCQFMPSSLLSLVETLPETPRTRLMLLKQYGLSMENGLKSTKGVFPYTYFTSFDVLKETKLPPIEAFANDLTEKACSPDTYALAQAAWDMAGCQTLEDYLVYYLRLDVALLADVFEFFREAVIADSELDPAHYFGAPGLSFSWFFKLTKARPQALRDPAMYEMFEQGIRGGMTFVNIHEAECKPGEQLIGYFDMNNLYGGAMTQKMPYSEFYWMTQPELDAMTTDWVMNYDVEGRDGFLAEVDLEYPQEVQDQTMDLPLAPESASISETHLSPYMQDLWKHYYPKRTFKGTTKLLLTHHSKTNYIVHSRALHYYIQRGLKITKVHRAITFTQRDFMKPYIDYHTSKRSTASTTAQKNLHKYMVNALFGKTMEDVRKHQVRRVTHSPSILFRNASSPLCESVMPLGPETAVVTLRRTRVVLNKPIFIGQCILDTSKLTMYDLLEQFRTNPKINNTRLIGGDTDSFFMLMQTPHDMNTILQSFPNFDASNYSRTHPLFSNKNKAQLGCFKDEACGQSITSFIALSPKMYSYKLNNDSTHNRTKGVKSYKKASLTHQMYRDAYANHTVIHVQQTLLQSREHTIHTITQRKRALSVWEDKRYWVSPNESYPYGHHRIPVINDKDDDDETLPAKRVCI